MQIAKAVRDAAKNCGISCKGLTVNLTLHEPNQMYEFAAGGLSAFTPTVMPSGSIPGGSGTEGSIAWWPSIL